MCQQGIEADQVRLTDGRLRPVDPCIAPLVQALNDAGFATRASCCGHGKQPANIILMDGREMFIAASYEQARAVERAFPPINATRSVPSTWRSWFKKSVELFYDGATSQSSYSGRRL